MSSSADDYVEGPRHAVITSDNVGPVITIVTLFLMVIMVLAVMLRLLVRFTTSHVPGADDAVVSIALAMALGEVIAITLTVNHGLGTRLTLLAPSQLVNVEKGVYAADFLYIFTIALAKASTLLLLRRLTALRSQKLAGRIIAAAILAWTVAAVFGLAFQCRLPHPWAVLTDRCFDLVSYWDAIGIVDILLDVALMIMPVYIVWNLQMPRQRKAVVVVGFTFRTILCVSQIFRLVYLHRLSPTHDGLYSSLGYILATQFETMFAVVVACIPAFKPFMDRAASGLIAISFKDRSGTYEMGSVNKIAKSGERSKQGSGRNGSSSQPKLPVFRPDGEYHAEISAASGSQSKAVSRQPSKHDIIPHKTVEWEVHYSDKARLTEGQNWPHENVVGS